jgi:hypothetical protein
MATRRQPTRGLTPVTVPDHTSAGTWRTARVGHRATSWPIVFGVAAFLAALIRLLFAGMPLTSDEGGYAEVTRLWKGGEELYEDAWADRPQGLFLVFRLVLMFGDSTVALRVAAVIVALLVLTASALVARRLIGDRAAVYATLLIATAGASPFIESFTLSGELIASVFSVSSLLAFVVYLERRDMRFIVLAGLLTGCAVMTKQSAFDAGLVAFAFLIWKQRDKQGAKAAAALVLSALIPVSVAMASAPDLGNWWHAVVTYRFEGDSLFSGGLGYRLLLFALGLRAAALALAVPLVLAVGGWRRSPTLLRLWLAGGLVGILGGGNFWAHYWIQIVPPLCMIAALRLEAMVASGDLRRVVRVLPVGVAAAFSLWMTVTPLVANPEGRVRAVTPGDMLRIYDDDIVAYLRAHTAPGDRVLVTPLAGGSIYFLADRRPAFRYMWYRPTQAIPGAVSHLRTILTEDPPALAVVLADPGVIDPSGRTTELLKTRYRIVTQIGPTAILAPRSSASS